jgi:hypothetical protein
MLAPKIHASQTGILQRIQDNLDVPGIAIHLHLLVEAPKEMERYTWASPGWSAQCVRKLAGKICRCT